MTGNAETLWWNLTLFLVSGILILIFGVMMTRTAARLADRTHLGEAVMGALFLGCSTSLPEIATSLTAALDRHPNLALGNAIGSVAGQTAFLAIADMTYRRANLEHAAASAANLMLAAFVLIMLSIPLLGMALPEVAVFGIHPASILMIAAYIYGIRLVSRVQAQPMWLPRNTSETRAAASQGGQAAKAAALWTLWSRFTSAAIVCAAAGWMLARTAVPITQHTGLSETVVGGVFTGVTGSLPEFVTALTAVRMGALTLAVGGVLGGNAFDTLLVGLSDLAYPGGTIFAAADIQQVFLLALSVLLTGILMVGLIYREKHGIGNIGTESVLILTIYVVGFISLSVLH